MWDAENRAKTVEQRFMDKVDKRPNGCWMWTASTVKGYGQFSLNGQVVGAHRASHLLFVGPIPEGLQIDHLCGQPLCVNPEHVEAVTLEENLKRSSTTWAGRNMRKTHCPQGHPYDGENLRHTPSGARYCITCKRIKKHEYRARKRAA